MNKKMYKYFKSKEGRCLKLSNGYSIKLKGVGLYHSDLMMMFCYDKEIINITFSNCDGVIIALCDYNSKQIRVENMEHVGQKIDATLCDWTKSEDYIDLHWE